MEVTACLRPWLDGLNNGNVSGAERTFAPQCVIHINGNPEPNLSLDGFKQMVSGLLRAFPDLRFTINDQIVAGDKVATRWTGEGTNSGATPSSPATGRRVQIAGLILDRVVDGQVVERWELWDEAGMMRQLAAV